MRTQETEQSWLRGESKAACS
uniref:Uncharacterized protein n=1 Tax=Anguilla anguilla TaxID=7936 RepID=A0A0E9UYZ5_ANGAN